MRRRLIFAGCLAAAACAVRGGTGTTGAANTPPPVANNPSTNATATASGHGRAFGYQPVSNAGYIFHRLDSLTLHLPGRAVQQQSLERTAYLHLTLAEAGGGYRATIVLDSLRVVASAVPVPEDSLAPVRGTRWTATVGADGHVSNLVADRRTTLGDQLTNHLRLFFPMLPAGGAKAGAEWSDSTEFPLKADAFDATEQARTRYRASENANGKGLSIESTGTYTRSGQGKRFEQELEMTASGKRHGVHRLGQDGVMLSADGTDSGDMTITVPSVGQTVPVNQFGRYEIRALGR